MTETVASTAGSARRGAVVLVAEHEPEVAELASRYLTRAGLTVRVVGDPEATIRALADHATDAAVIDIAMPGLDARRLRRTLATVPPIRTPPTVFVVPADTPPPRPLPGGAAYLPRPFSPRALVDRVVTALAAPAAAAPIPDRATRRVTVAGREITVTRAQFAVLAALIRDADRVVTRERLLAAVHEHRAVRRRPAGSALASLDTPRLDGPTRPGDRDPNPRSVDVHVAELRAKLPRPSPIRTVRGAGYVLDGAAVDRRYHGVPDGPAGPAR